MSRRLQKSIAKDRNQPDLFAFAAAVTKPPGAHVVGERASGAEAEPKTSPSTPVGSSSVPASRQPSPDKPIAVFRQVVEPRSVHLLDVRAAAAWLGLSKSTLDKMRCYGTGPRYIRATCRAVRYDPEDLRAFAEARREVSTGEA
jgi:predicted DNA-binding transcriptional regulator AlpA